MQSPRVVTLAAGAIMLCAALCAHAQTATPNGIYVSTVEQYDDATLQALLDGARARLAARGR